MSDHPKIHAYLAQLGIASRRKAEALVIEGRISINDQPAQVGDRVQPGLDLIKLDGKSLLPQTTNHVYFIVNKPKGVISTASDELGRPTVLQLLPTGQPRVFPVGRLDKDSEGLMLLTNDGELAFRLTHPKFTVPKRYKVLVNTRPTLRALEFMRRGVKLDGELTTVAEVEIVSEAEDGCWLELVVHEGRYHHVRRLLERAGYQTIRLIRLSIGPLTISDLHGKRYQQLAQHQIKSLREYVGLQ